MKRRVRKDSTFQLDNRTYEVSGRHLAGKYVTVVLDALTDRPLRVTWQERVVRFGLCDPVENSRRRHSTARDSETDHHEATVPFDPITALLEKARKADDE